jgi:hypothetical protein
VWPSKIYRVSECLNDHFSIGATHLDATPSLLPVPTLDRHIVTPRQHQAQRRVHRQTSDVVRVSLERRDLLAGRDVVDAQLEVIRAGDELRVSANHPCQVALPVRPEVEGRWTHPVLSGDISDTSHGDISDLEGLEVGLGFIVPNLDLSIAVRSVISTTTCLTAHHDRSSNPSPRLISDMPP